MLSKFLIVSILILAVVGNLVVSLPVAKLDQLLQTRPDLLAIELILISYDKIY